MNNATARPPLLGSGASPGDKVAAAALGSVQYSNAMTSPAQCQGGEPAILAFPKGDRGGVKPRNMFCPQARRSNGVKFARLWLQPLAAEYPDLDNHAVLDSRRLVLPNCRGKRSSLASFYWILPRSPRVKPL